MKKILVIVAAVVFMFLFVAQTSALATQVVMDVDSVKLPGWTYPIYGDDREVKIGGTWTFFIERNGGDVANFRISYYMRDDVAHTLAFNRESGRTYRAKISLTPDISMTGTRDKNCYAVSGSRNYVRVMDYSGNYISCPGTQSSYFLAMENDVSPSLVYDFGAV